MTAVVWALSAVVAGLTLLVVGLLRSHATVLRALAEAGIDLDPDHAHDHGSPSGTALNDHGIRTIPGVPGPAGASGVRAADLSGLTPTGASRSVSAKSRTSTLLAFLSTGCSTCATFWDAFAKGIDLPEGIRLVVVTKGPEAESPAEVAAMAPTEHLTLQSSAAWDDYRIPVAPYFVLIDGRRGVVVGEGAAASWPRVNDLLLRAMADADLAPGRVARRDLFTGRARSARVDATLREAGIEPGDPRLHHGADPDGSHAG